MLWKCWFRNVCCTHSVLSNLSKNVPVPYTNWNCVSISSTKRFTPMIDIKKTFTQVCKIINNTYQFHNFDSSSPCIEVFIFQLHRHRHFVCKKLKNDALENNHAKNMEAEYCVMVTEDCSSWQTSQASAEQRCLGPKPKVIIMHCHGTFQIWVISF